MHGMQAIEASESGYAVKVDAFEGPMDLLLHLIKKNQVNIYDIPIALITRQYLETLDLMQSLNLAVAGEFLVMAATLLHIKSRLLLPVPEPEDAEEDPRLNLVHQLLIYQQFKGAAEQLEVRERHFREVFRRNPTPPSDATSDEVFLGEVSLFDLLSALQEVTARLPNPIVMSITEEALSISDRMQFILERTAACESLLFHELFDTMQQTRYRVIVTFCALLEVVRLGLIRLLQIDPNGPIRLFRTVTVEGDAAAGDDEDGGVIHYALHRGDNNGGF